ncbi:DUF3558 family protein [Amycolatopsis cynarae]|uniref:DUF3558 family protein n=1 Tax=Amycolatopsis cynarae TaxID=2995223 RepID=A0ABY7AVA8_9PSEU|nr:DUF3558 family protein [Amycolatopsis sp. HUAS 11-8]WAL63672.1 DUF3558 family protein [Amycolatopsis sp. HUAS 11-8]
MAAERGRAALPVLLACGLLTGCLLAGCGAKASPAAAPGAGQSPSQGTSPVVPPVTASLTGVAALSPCELMTPAERSAAGLTSAGRAKTIGSARACDWTEPGTFGLTVTLDETAALTDLHPSGGTKTTVGGHAAIKVPGSGDGTCAVLLAAGGKATAQVDITNTNFRDTRLACQRAATVAQLIEPKLPEER